MVRCGSGPVLAETFYWSCLTLISPTLLNIFIFNKPKGLIYGCCCSKSLVEHSVDILVKAGGI